METFQLHGPTVQLVTAVLIMVLAVVMFLIWRLYPTVPGVQLWGLSSLSAVMVMLLAFSRGSNLSLLNLALTNLAVIMVAYLILCGCRAYVGKPVVFWRLHLTLICLTVFLIVLLEVLGAQVWLRLSVQGWVQAIIFLLAARVLFMQDGLRRATPNFFILTASIHAAFLILVRPWLAQRHFETERTFSVPPGVALEALIFFTVISIVVILLVTEHVNRQLAVLSEVDGLTDLFNRRTFLRLLEKARSSALRSGKPLAMMMLDLDHFKLVNDRFGHQGGDQVLRSFSALAQRNLRAQDVMGRLGGEEFAIFLPDTPFEQAKLIAQRLLRACETDEVLWDEQAIRYTTSIGLTMLNYDDDQEGRALERADKALYEAKNSGRNRCIAAHSPNMPPEALLASGQEQPAGASSAGR